MEALLHYIIIGLGALSGFLAIWLKAEKSKNRALEAEKTNLDAQKKSAEARAKIAEKRAQMHREVAKTVIKNIGIAEKKADELTKRIDNAKDGETITVSF